MPYSRNGRYLPIDLPKRCVCRICKKEGDRIIQTDTGPYENFIALQISDELHGELGHIWFCTDCHSRLKTYFDGLIDDWQIESATLIDKEY